MATNWSGKSLQGIILALLLVSAGVNGQQPDFSRALQQAGQLPRLHSLLIYYQDELVVEEYFNGRDRFQPANMKSASKSVISALVGIAIEQGLIEDIRQPIAEFFPEYATDLSDIAKQAITIEDLLTMQSGLESTSNRNYGRWVLSDNWVEFILQQPLVSKPGEEMIYSTGSTHLLSAIISRTSGMTTRDYAQRYLATPLGVSLAYWSQDPQGIYFGGNDLEMTPRAMLAFGRLYLQEGAVDQGRVLAASWVNESFQPHATSPRGQGRFYGYGWWLRDLADMLVPVAWGFGGQLIFVVKDYGLVVVATSDSRPGTGRRTHLSSLYDLVEAEILWPVKRASGPLVNTESSPGRAIMPGDAMSRGNIRSSAD
ncbi:MAG: serine hydrolase [Gammaproteobacteria bacterium]